MLISSLIHVLSSNQRKRLKNLLLKFKEEGTKSKYINGIITDINYVEKLNKVKKEPKFKFYSLYDKQTGNYLFTGLNSTTKEEAINEGVEFLLSDNEDGKKTQNKIRRFSIEQKEDFLESDEIYVEGHNEKYESEF